WTRRRGGWKPAAGKRHVGHGGIDQFAFRAGGGHRLGVAALLEIVVREHRAVAAGPERLRLLHRLSSFVALTASRQRQTKVVGRGYVERLFGERGTESRNRLWIVLLLEQDLAKIDPGGDVAWIDLFHALERFTGAIGLSLCTRDEAEHVLRARIARQLAGRSLGLALSALEVQRVAQGDAHIDTRQRERRIEAERLAECRRRGGVVELLEQRDASVVVTVGVLASLGDCSRLFSRVERARCSDAQRHAGNERQAERGGRQQQSPGGF